MKRNILLLFSVLVSIPSLAEWWYTNSEYPNAFLKIVHSENYVYFCHSYDYINFFEKKTGDWYCYSQANGMLPSRRLSSMAIHCDTLWVGDMDGWVTSLYYDKADSTRYELRYPSLSWQYIGYRYISAIAFDYQGRIALGIDTCIKGIVNGVATDFYEIPYPVTEQAIGQMKFDSKGTLWIIAMGQPTKYFLSKFTFEDGIEYFSNNLERPWPFRHTRSTCLAIDKNDHVWFSPSDQLVEYDGETFHVYEIGVNAKDMAFDDEGRLWIVTSGGTLCCFSEGEIIASYSLNVRCFCLDIDGDVIYIGTDTGALRFENGQASPIEFPEFTPTVVRPPLAVPDNIAVPRMFTLDGRPIDGNTTKKGIVIKKGKKVMLK